jgi:3-deoxy-D-manno-octulosonate 8-phosphate phosphatase (KDO 8-P phosphatase)
MIAFRLFHAPAALPPYRHAASDRALATGWGGRLWETLGNVCLAAKPRHGLQSMIARKRKYINSVLRVTSMFVINDGSEGANLSRIQLGFADKAPTMTTFILDVDGVMTTGQFLYTADGKAMKVFGPDDNDGLSLLRPYIEVRFVTGDQKGYAISSKRIVDDMKFPLDLVSTIRRVEWIEERYPLQEVIYMGDGLFDHYVMRKVGYAIAPANADALAKAQADYVTTRMGGDRAVAEACLHVLEKFFVPYEPAALPRHGEKLLGAEAL